MDGVGPVSLIQRVHGILLKPKATWPQIDAEATTAGALWRGYVFVLAAIPAVAALIHMRWTGATEGASLQQLALSQGPGVLLDYLFSLLKVAIFAACVDGLAHIFGCERNPLNALKLAAYCMTASFVGSAFILLPIGAFLGTLLGILAVLYGLYLLHLGLPVLMKCREESARNYMLSVAMFVLVFSGLLNWISYLATPSVPSDPTAAAAQKQLRKSATPNTSNAPSEPSVQLPGTDIRIDPRNEAAALQKFQETAQQLEASLAAGTADEASKVLGQMVLAITADSTSARLFSVDQLKPFLPQALLGTARDGFSIEKTSFNPANIKAATVRGAYKSETFNIQIAITDMALNRQAMASWAMQGADLPKELYDQQVDSKEGRAIRERERKDSIQSEIKILLPNGLMVQAMGNVPMVQLKSALMGFDFQQLGAMHRPVGKAS
jgi:hypothetical protein